MSPRRGPFLALRHLQPGVRFLCPWSGRFGRLLHVTDGYAVVQLEATAILPGEKLTWSAATEVTVPRDTAA